MFISGKSEGDESRVPRLDRPSSFRLQALRGRRGKWGYKKGGTPAVEPSVLSSLGLFASGNRGPAASDLAGAQAAAEWLVAIQHPDGSLPVSEDIGIPGWTTPYALFLWHAVPGFEESRHRARAWLLGSRERPCPAASRSPG